MKTCLWDKVVGHVLEKKLSWPQGWGGRGLCPILGDLRFQHVGT